MLLPNPAAGARAARGSQHQRYYSRFNPREPGAGRWARSGPPGNGLRTFQSVGDIIPARAQPGLGTENAVTEAQGQLCGHAQEGTESPDSRGKKRKRAMLSGTPRRRGSGRSGAETRPPKGPRVPFSSGHPNIPQGS